MAYVGDNGKRVAPKHRSRPARKPKPTPVKPPAGDIASSGGDYGTRKAKEYAATRASRRAVRQTYAEQPTARRQQISSASRNRPGPAAAAIRHEHRSRISSNQRSAGLTTPGSLVPGIGQVQQQRRSEHIARVIEHLHSVRPISTTGDTKSNLELATAQVHQASPGYAKDILAAAEAGNKYRAERRTVETGPAAALSPTGIVQGAVDLVSKANPALAAIKLDKILSGVTSSGQAKPGWKNLPENLVKEAIDLPAQAVPSTYHGLIEPAIQGDFKTVGKNAVQQYVDIAKHPVRQIQEHPLSTGLAVYGPAKGVSNILGTAAKRAGAVPTLRPNAVFPNTAMTQVRPTARGIVGATYQTIKDKPVRRGDKPLPLMTPDAVRRTAHNDRGADEEARRIDRELAAHEANTAIGKKPTAAHILASQNIVNNIGELRAYRGRIEARRDANVAQLKDKQERAKLSKRDVVSKKRFIAAQNLTLQSIDDFMKSKGDNKQPMEHLPNHADFPPKIREEIESYKAISSHMQGRLGELYGQSSRLEMRRLTPYALQHMDAKFVKSGFFDNKQNKIISKDEAATLRKDLTGDEYEARVSGVSNVFATKDNRLLKPDEIRQHMRHGEDNPEKIWGVNDEHLNQMRDQLSQMGPFHPLRDDLEARIASSIVELQDIKRASGKEVNHQIPDHELTIIKKVADNQDNLDRIGSTLENLRNREATTEGAGAQGAVLRERIQTLEREQKSFKTAQRQALGKWRRDRTIDPALGATRTNAPTEPAYIGQAPNRRAASSYFVNTAKPQAITPSGFTGKSVQEGLGNLGPGVPREDYVRAQGLVTAAERFQKMIRDVAVRRDPQILEDASGEITKEADFPQVLTLKSKRAAQAMADDLNEKYPDHKVTPVKIALDANQQKRFLDEANSDEHMGELVQSAIQDALEGKGNNGTWALMPKDYVDEAAKYLNVNKPIARMFGSQFRRTVLGLSLPWMVGNIGEASLRSALERSGPRSYYTGKMVLKHLKETDPDTWKELQIRAAGGGHYGIQRSSGIYTSTEHLDAASRPVRALADAIVALKNNKVTGPPARGAGRVWDAWTDLVFNKVNSRIESQFQTAMMGKAIREQLMSDKLFKLSKKAMSEAVDGKLDVRTVDMLGREVDRMYGQYSKFNPTIRKMVAHETPFIAWYLNAVRFIYKTLPRDHPVVTSVIAGAYEATEEWRKDQALGLFLEGHLPYFLQGSVPNKGGHLRIRYTPFSVMDDPLGSTASLVFPQFKTIILNLMGKDWKGDDLKGYDSNQLIGAVEAVKSLSEGLIPGLSHISRYSQTREGESDLDRFRRGVGDPFLNTKTATQAKSSGTTKSPVQD
jgi:hypothetical protein